jgi:serine/threonine-protein kinase
MGDDIAARSPVVPGEIVAGKYRVDRVLGAGGMGVVVAATHVELAQPVALKFILPSAVSGAESVERFMREARAAVRLKSEHVARVYDVGRDANDRPFMVLELLEGSDLARLAKQKGSLPVADAVEYVLQACEALVEAHAAGIVHRDLKPQNLFVTRRLNGAPLVKVLDFGIAKAIGPAAFGQMALTDSAAVIGSPLYMAPEQMRSARRADIRTDLWALGVILYELLGGQLPFEGETVTEVCIRVVNEDPPALLALRPALDSGLVGVVMKCLAKEPDARWQNVAQLAAALEPFSRSAQPGGLVRPWRSFEDTQSSAPIGGAGSRPEDTGPSTAVTVPSGDLPAPEFSSRGGSSPGASPASHPPALVSTDVSWDGSGRSGPPPPGRTPRTFAKGLAAGLALAALGAVVFGIAQSRSVRLALPAPVAPSAMQAAPPPSVQAPNDSIPDRAAEPTEAAETVTVAASELPAAEPAVPSAVRPTPPRVRTKSSARPGTGREGSPPGASGTTGTNSPTSATTAAATAGPAPNGAPILP